jgi:hypothetical protein
MFGKVNKNEFKYLFNLFFLTSTNNDFAEFI